jgi:hypothetical protein
MATGLRRMLLQSGGATKLLCHPRHAGDLTGIVRGDAPLSAEPGRSAVQDNYQFFVRAVQDDASRMWRGLQRLEHVVIRLTAGADPQQVFESLNSTAVPLQDHELIHNYVLMGLPYAQQVDVEDNCWTLIEDNTGEMIDNFFRDYLIQKTGRDSEFTGEHGIYTVFRGHFPRLGAAEVTRHRAEWTEMSGIYATVLHPDRCQNPAIATQLRFVSVFGSAMYPVVMAVYRDFQNHRITDDEIMRVLEQVQSLYLRRMIVGLTRDHLAAQLCRALRRSGYPIREIARRTPPDEQVRYALRSRALPHAGYVLARLQRVGDPRGLEIEHIFPQFPAETWSGDGARLWATCSDDERAGYRARLQTLGNLTLLEQPLNAAASNKPFHDKKAYYSRSQVEATRDLTGLPVWDLREIDNRITTLTEDLLTTWPRPQSPWQDDTDHLVPILDATKTPGWYRGWRTEYEYVKVLGQIWDATNVKVFYNRLFRWLWDNRRDDVLAYVQRHNGPIYMTKQWNGQWDPLPGSHFLFMGLFPQYMLQEVKDVLDALLLAEDVFVKYATDDETDVPGLPS